MRVFKYSIFLVLLLLLCSCGNNKYSLTELCGQEATAYLLSDNASIILALYSEKGEKAEEFITSLADIAKRTKENIYYVDVNHLDIDSKLALAELFSESLDNYYIIYDNGQLVLNEKYDDYYRMYKNINGKHFNSKVEYLKNEEKIEYFNNAQKTFTDGRLSESLNYLNLIWSMKEAKDYYFNHDEYKIINNWEAYKKTNKEDETIYTSLIISDFSNQIGYYQSKFKIEDINLPSYNDYKFYYFYYKDGFIYVSSKNDGNYKKRFEIKKIGNNFLNVKDGKEDYEFNLS